MGRQVYLFYHTCGAVKPYITLLIEEGVDTQQILPFGTPEQVKDEVKRRIADLGSGGRFYF